MSRRHVRARPRGLRQLPLQKLVGRGSAHRSGSGPATLPGGGVWGRGGVFGTSGAAEIVGAAQPRACRRRPAVSAARFRAGRGGVASEPAARGACTALTPAAPRQAGARSSMVASERDEPPVLHRPQR